MEEYHNPKLVVQSGRVRSGKITWRSPSNIALIKYWGKYGQQMPCNPSLSFTLDAAYTETTLEYGPKMSDKPGVSVDFLFHNEQNKAFGAKIERYLTSLLPIYPFLSQIELTIFSSNSFPHSAGIASSASAMSALALCLCTLEDELFGTLSNDEEFEKKASYLARLGSGSACRSIFSKAALWGETIGIPNSSNLYAIGWGHHLHPVFSSFHDDILIISKEEKSVSSTVGHSLMDNNPYAETRYMTVDTRMRKLISILKSGDVEGFGALVEQEAYSLHGLMMLSEPPYLLIKPNTVAAIEQLTTWRQSQKVPLYFTLDAGPNLHLLYPDEYATKVQSFIHNELLKYCAGGEYIPDKVGEGPRQL
ncbi:MAG TPA: diphosphomevalonate decarboxylase [Saprospiraceae bacterium]|nr:diphosphomevalonate decarboxylase [Saprospiraceae bacterium]HQW95649.1 diphosphomevalonate decarboxylase [Saprospiraceae bacterium]